MKIRIPYSLMQEKETAPAAKVIAKALEMETLSHESAFAARLALDGFDDFDPIMYTLNVSAELRHNPCVYNYYGPTTGNYDVFVTADCYEDVTNRFVKVRAYLSEIYDAIDHGPRTSAWRYAKRKISDGSTVYNPTK